MVAVACLPEVPEPVRTLREFHRILKPDGLVCLFELLTDPDYPWRGTEKRWADEVGFELSEEFENWFVYQLNFRKRHPDRPLTGGKPAHANDLSFPES